MSVSPSSEQKKINRKIMRICYVPLAGKGLPLEMPVSYTNFELRFYECLRLKTFILTFFFFFKQKTL